MTTSQEGQDTPAPAPQAGGEADRALQAERRALERHYYEDGKYKDRLPQIIKEYEEAILRAQKVLDRRHELTYEPELAVGTAEDVIKLGRQLRDSAADSCLPVGLAARIAARPEILTGEDIKNTDPRMLANIAFVQTALEIPMGNALINRAMKNSVITCTQEAMPMIAGFYSRDLNLLTATTGDLKDGEIDAGNLLTFYEELYHADQTEHRRFDHHMDFGRYHRQDISLWSLGVEANAKVAAALMIMEHADNGHDEFRQEILENIESESDGAIFKAVSDAYEKHGLQALRDDPKLLAPAFEAFFSESGMAKQYMQGYLLDIQAMRISQPDEFQKLMRGTRRFSLDDFVDAFGKIPGTRGNMLEGRYQSREDLLRLFPEESQFRKWLTGEFSFAADGVGIPQGAPPAPAPTAAPKP
jgi:hypothetical protein